MAVSIRNLVLFFFIAHFMSVIILLILLKDRRKIIDIPKSDTDEDIDNDNNDYEDTDYKPDSKLEQTSKTLEHSCNECEKSFKSINGLRAHQLKHGKKLKCEVCGREFNCKFLT